MSESNYLSVDHKGLAKLLELRGRGWALLELIQNAWDSNAKNVSITVKPVPRRSAVKVVVEDDCPDGFADLTHAWTLFAESCRKGDVHKRGRFNIGEKLVIAICESATIVSTTGAVEFKDGKRRLLRRRRDKGSIFEGVLLMSRDDLDQAEETIRAILPPRGIKTTFNGEVIEYRKPAAKVEEILPTERADAEGYLRRTARKGVVEIVEVEEDEVAHVYEMGIPIVETGDKYHYNVLQKVPLNMNRDNVPPSYLRSLRVYALNATFKDVEGEEEATDTWVRDAAGDERAADKAVKHVVTERFGEKRVAFDPSDPEANKLAVSKGYTLVTGGALSKGEWSNVKRSGAALPAGRVTPSPKAYSDDPNAPETDRVPKAQWTADQRVVVAYIHRLAVALLDGKRPDVLVEIVKTNNNFGAAYGGGRLHLNQRRLGKRWFKPENVDNIHELLIHELGHEWSGDHLSEKYHDALCYLGARIAKLALEQDYLFDFDNIEELAS